MKRQTKATDSGATAPSYPLISKDWEDPKNEGLHQLYVAAAVKHLTALRKAQDELAAFANVNLMEAEGHLQQDVQKLVRENPAYRDAAALLFAGIGQK